MAELGQGRPQHHAGDEFEREPVPETALKGPSAFWGMYAGEHTAGTEFMIGPLFVAWGASAFDLIFGLLLGNLLAVLTWRFLTAEIATQRRLTLYYHLEQITGRWPIIAPGSVLRYAVVFPSDETTKLYPEAGSATTWRVDFVFSEYSQIP